MRKIFTTVIRNSVFFSFRPSLRPFCSIQRLDLTKLLEEPKIVSVESPKLTEDKGIVEFNNSLNWQQEVIDSPVPVVIDVYAELYTN